MRPQDVPFDAVNQAEVFTRGQAYAEGLTRRQVRRRLDSARWKVVAGAALADASTPIGPWQQAGPGESAPASSGAWSAARRPVL